MPSLADSLRNFTQSASNSIAGNVSAPVDGIAWALRKAGVPIPDKPMGGSDWMADKGLTRPTEQSLSGLLGEFAGMAGPMVAAAKVPQIARGLLQAGDNLAAPTNLSRQAGVFIGPGAKTWNAADAGRAKVMADAGTDARQVWSETGTWKGPDGMWRQEVSDERAGVRLGQQLDALGLDKLGSVIDHRELYKSYPDLKNINTRFNQTAGAGSFYAPREYAQYLEMPQSTGLGAKATPKQANSVAIHEMQHAVQQKEGWAKGGSTESFGSIPFTEAKNAGLIGKNLSDVQIKYQLYRRLAGEAEARATQARIPLDATQRRAMFPEDSYDVPIKDLIIRGLTPR